jgi:cytochrome c oxidase assembly protein subunit 15
LTWPKSDADVAVANAAFPERPVEHSKTWPEQVHRHLAAILGLLVLGMSLWASRAERFRWAAHGVPVALVLAAIHFYTESAYALAGGLAIVAELILLGAAWRWRDPVARLLALVLLVIVFQALLGKWTVTWQLKPFIVTAHLLGGMTTLTLLFLVAMKMTPQPRAPRVALPSLLLIAGVGVVAIQIALGGWVSTNYAALACPDFPRCQGQWWPATDFGEAFVLWRGIGVDYEGGILDGAARTAIHLVHRLGAIVVTGVLLVLGWRCLKDPMLKLPGLVMLAALTAQIALGISNVVFGLPLWVATLHNGMAACLLLSLAWIAVRRWPAAEAGR